MKRVRVRAALMIGIVCLAAVAQAADSLATPSPMVTTAADTTTRDSVAAAALRDSLLAVQRAYTDRYARYPSSLDSTMHPYRLYPYQVRQSNAAAVSTLLRRSPLFVTIPYSLSSSLNRFLFMGYPTPRRALFEPYEYRLAPVSPVTGSDRLFLTNLDAITLTPGQSLAFEPRRLPTVAPFTSLYWENGVFDENTLRVLFARPLTRRLSIGLISNYRWFKADDYSHRNGGIYSSYAGAVADTSLLVHTGTNPLTNEHEVSVSAAWHDRTKAHLRYSYFDLHNGKSRLPDTAGGRFDTLHQYAHNISLGLDSARLGRIHLQTNLLLRSEVAREHRVTDSRGAYVRKRRGEQFTVGGEALATIGLGERDTLRLRLDSRYDHKEFYNPRDWALAHSLSTFSGRYTRWLGNARTNAQLSLGLGYTLETANEQLGHGPTWDLHARATHAQQRLDLYARRDALGYTPPLDLRFASPVTVPDFVDMYGASLYLHRGTIGLLTSYSYSTGVDSASLRHAWPEGQYPYPEPHSVVVVSPRLGPYFGFSLYSRYLLADVRPYHKLGAGLTYEAHVADGHEHLRFDIGFDYWSVRDTSLYAGIDTWHRPIKNLYAEASAQIQSFRFFYKIDNILNRKMAYVPGYFLPGLTFRWGFDWYFRR